MTWSHADEPDSTHATHAHAHPGHGETD
jgi:hypothetical protein